MADEMNPTVKTDIPLTEGLSPESAVQEAWRSQGLEATEKDPAKVPAAELLDIRVTEVRDAGTAVKENEAVASYCERLQKFERNWPASPVTHATNEAREIIAIIENSLRPPGTPPVVLTTSLENANSMLAGALKSAIREISAFLPSSKVIETLSPHLTPCLDKIEVFIRRAMNGYNGEIFQENADNLRALESAERSFESFRTTRTERRWQTASFSKLKEAMDKIDLMAPLLTREVRRAPESITFTDLPRAVQKRFSEELNKREDLVEQQFRASNEARCLRLFREIQTAPDESFGRHSAARKIAAQLALVDVADLQKILDGLEPRLLASARHQFLFKQLVSEAFTAAAAQQSPHSDPANNEIPSPDNASTAEEPVVAEVDETREFLTLFLDQFGIQDPNLIEALLPRFSVHSIDRLEQQLAEVTPQVVRLLIERTPETIYPENPEPLRVFLKQWRQTLQESAGLDSLLIFDPTRFPEHFCSVERLVRTSNAAALVFKVREEVTTDYYRNRAPEDAPAPAAPQPEAPLVHPEQHLIDRLARFTDHPYIAYGLLREGFYYDNSYKTTGVPRGFRDRLLKSVFEPAVHPKLMRRVERDLLKWEFLKDHSNTSRGTDGLLSINPINEVSRADVRELLIDLTNVQTRRTNLPKLSGKQEA